MNLEKAIKIIGQDTIDELSSMDKDALKNRIVSAEEAMRDVQQELDDNALYQEVLANKKAMESGKKEVDKRQKAIIAYVLHLLSLQSL